MSATEIDYAKLAAQAGAISSTPPPASSGGVDYTKLAAQAGAISSTPPPAPISQGVPPSLLQVLMQPTQKTDQEYQGYTGPAGVAGATIHGLSDVARGTIGAIKGAWDTLAAPPKDNTEAGIGAVSPVALPLYRSVKPLVGAAMSVPQIPGAVRDINSSSDPTGIYANVAQDTASQGAGQALTGLAAEGLTRGVKAGASAITNATKSPVTAVIPEAANLPRAAIEGAEKVFKAAAPVGTDPGFRANVYAAAGDLAEVGRNLNLSEAKGGIINPDLRVRATVNALNDHLQSMYEDERAPQIERNADTPIQLNLDADATNGLKYLSRRAGTQAARSLASDLLKESSWSMRSSGGTATTVADVDQIAKVVNKELLGFESMTPAERSASAATSQRYAGLKALDKQLGDSLNGALQEQGETGVTAYERRYAAVSSIRDRLQRQMNAVELSQPGILKAITRPVISAATGGVKSALGQATIADVNPGRMLQDGLKTLADSGIQPNRSGAAPTTLRGAYTAAHNKSGGIP